MRSEANHCIILFAKDGSQSRDHDDIAFLQLILPVIDWKI